MIINQLVDEPLANAPLQTNKDGIQLGVNGKSPKVICGAFNITLF